MEAQLKLETEVGRQCVPYVSVMFPDMISIVISAFAKYIKQ